jgi:hypothetical protein
LETGFLPGAEIVKSLGGGLLGEKRQEERRREREKPS